MNNKKMIFKIFVVLAILLLIFTGYKLFILNKYKAEEVIFNNDRVFNEILTVETFKETDDSEILNFEGICIKNYFDGYEADKNNSNFKVKYDNDGKITSFYSISKSKQYIKMLSLESLNLYSENNNDKYEFDTEESTSLFLEKYKIKNDVDFLNYIKDNYFVKSNIFTSMKSIKHNFLVNSFVGVALPEFNNIVLIDGKINGYILNLKMANAKEIHILNNDVQYIIMLFGDEITTNEFVTNLLETVKFCK